MKSDTITWYKLCVFFTVMSVIITVERSVSLFYPTEGVDVDPASLFVSWAEVHWSSNQKDISDAILVDVQPTHLTAIVGSNLPTGTCNYISLPVDGVVELVPDMRSLLFSAPIHEQNENEWPEQRVLPVLHWGPVQCWHRHHCWVQTGWLCLCVWSVEPRPHKVSSSPQLSQMKLCSLETCLHTRHYTLLPKLWPPVISACKTTVR